MILACFFTEIFERIQGFITHFYYRLYKFASWTKNAVADIMMTDLSGFGKRRDERKTLCVNLK